MRELPILFSGDMVRALLDGTKTQTRRIIKPQPTGANTWTWYEVFGKGFFPDKHDAEPKILKSPYQVGDILYVQETWRCVKYDSTDGDLSYGVEFKDGTRKYFEFDDNERFHQFGKFAFKDGWQPSMFMPKEAARIWLEVTDVRVERVREITEEDAKAEGAKQKIWYQPYGTKREEEQLYVGDIVKHEANYLTGFAGLWDSLCDQQENSFYSSPYVWVYGLKRLEGYR